MVLVLSREEVHAVLDMPSVVDAVERGLVQFSLGQVIQPLRVRLFMPEERSFFASMPAYLGADKVVGAKMQTYSGLKTEQGISGLAAVVAICDPLTGDFLALMHGTRITEMRCAAAAAVATRHLALPDAEVLGILGAGVQGRAHLWAISSVRPIRRVKLYDLSSERAAQYRVEMEGRFGLPVEVCDSAEAVVRESQVIATVTTSRSPVLLGSWLQDGAHVNAMGAHTPETRELDTEAVGRGKLVTDSLQSLFAEAGEALIPIAEGRMTREQVYGEIGEIAAGRKPGRVDPREITLFKALGVAVEDVVTAKLAYDRAMERGLGIEVEM